MNTTEVRRWKSRALWALAAGASAAATTEARADGVVTTNLSDGVLTITGDGSDNQISVYPTAGMLLLESSSGTVVDGIGQFPPASVNSVVVRMGDGNDRVTLFGFSTDALDVDLGPGGGLLSVVDCSVSGACSVTGSGDSVFFAHTGGTIGGPLSFRSSGGTGELLLAALTLQGSLSADLTQCLGTANRVSVQGCTLLGKTTVRTGGADTACSVDMSGSSLTGALSVVGGEGSDTVRILQCPLAGKISVKTGGGSDVIDFDSGSSSRTPALLDGGTGDDIVVANNSGEFLLAGVKMKGGSGSDTLGIGTAYPGTLVSGNVMMLGGSGDDTITLDNTVADTVKIDGGGGNDNVIVRMGSGNLLVADGKGGTDTVSAADSGNNSFDRTKVRGFEAGE
ncbi:MAG: hypothetical protein HMLKMBBP_03441 [Planctomycetes bacterium]|nr:hypothetical protein [Planctomycetota bacterium]